ncbi:MmgE/PrpD family protein [Castellaniella sp. GW247-6E4]|uniref:MmgE/PrpD family protein n=1 Tax=Castellaniella sp. GW247-6E4 TaxID=3140380 RepID=UPI00331617FA
MSTEVADTLATFAANLKYEDIPEEVVDYTKFLALKTISGMVAGSIHPSGVRAASVIKRKNLPQEITLIHSGFKTSLWEAIFLNAFYAHVQELEDDRIGGGVSWDITVVAIILALAERYKLSGRDTLLAMVVGLELHTRTCLFSAEHIGLTVVPGAVGPAAGAAKAIGLDAHQTAMAMGLALSSANLSFVNFGTDTHFFESSIHSVQAVAAAEMASVGLTSNPDIARYLDGLLGKGKINPEDYTRDLGERWLLTEIMIKKYPCCFMIHRQVDSLFEIMRSNNLSQDDVKRIHVHATPGDKLCNRPDPKTEGEMQFSFQHTLGAALVRGVLSLDEFKASAAADPELLAARAKVEVTMDPDGSQFVMVDPSRITVTTWSGMEFSDERLHPVGSKQDPLTLEGMRKVYRQYVGDLYSPQDAERVAELVLGLDRLDDISSLMEILAQSDTELVSG